jgi:hypothetical protein
MIILDIDQDFFFYPTFYGGILSSYDKNRREKFSEMKAVHSHSEVLNKFKVKFLPGKIFINHHELYYELTNLKIQNAKIIHVDAHSDIYGLNEKASVNLSNFLLKCVEENITREIDWIRQDVSDPKPPDEVILKSTELFHLDHKFKFRVFKFSEYELSGQIDRLYYTLSPNFCPTDLLLVHEMKKHIF